MKNTVLVTGATDGIGRRTALDILRAGHKVIVHGRSEVRIQRAIDGIISASKLSDLEGIQADFTSLSQVKKMADEIIERFPTLNGIVNNAGVYMNTKKLTEDGFEMSLAVNHLAPFALTLKLLPLLKANAPSRIINVSSVAHSRGKLNFSNLNAEKSFDGYEAYSLSKLANVLFTKELSKRLTGSGITVNALHPGVITTKLLKTGFGMSGGSLSEGAETSVYLATSDEVKDISGEYFNKKQITQPSPIADDEESLTKFWEASEEMTGVRFGELLF